MTKAELSESIRQSMPDNPNVADAIAQLVEANEQINQIDELCASLATLIEDVSMLDLEIADTDEQIQEATQAEQKKCCDPIGFQLEDGTQFDFIIDDGNFDSTSDFLGADNQWAEMTALDTDGDKVVSADEFQNGNIKAVKTDKDGNQSIVDILSAFGKDFSVNLSSYKEGGKHSAIDTESDFDNDGVKDQNLLGTFNVNINGEKISGYNTLDDVDYLSKTYGVSADAPSASDALKETGIENTSSEVAKELSFLKTFTNATTMLRNKLNEAYTQFGLTNTQILEINESCREQAEASVGNFFTDNNIVLDEEEKENKEAEEEKEEKEKEEEVA